MMIIRALPWAPGSYAREEEQRGSQATCKQFCAASERAEAAGSVQRELATLLQSSGLILLPAPGIFWGAVLLFQTEETEAQ